jgi:hypothetical protein
MILTRAVFEVSTGGTFRKLWSLMIAGKWLDIREESGIVLHADHPVKRGMIEAAVW